MDYLKLNSKSNLVVILEATGVYSLPLEMFLTKNDYNYIYMNPLKAKKIMNDKVDAKRLAMIEFLAPQPLQE